MRERLGIGRLLKEEKLVDNRPKTNTAPSRTLDSPRVALRDELPLINPEPSLLI